MKLVKVITERKCLLRHQNFGKKADMEIYENDDREVDLPQTFQLASQLGFSAIKMLKKISVALLTHGNITIKILKHFYHF